MRSRSLLLWVVAAFAVAALLVAPTAHVAHASTSGVVISAMYGGGGSADGPGGSVLSPYLHDYIEIFNAGSTAVTMANWSIQYRDSPTGSWEKTNIPAGTVLQPGQYFLTEQDAGNDGVGAALPAPDAFGSASMTKAGNFVVALMSTWTTNPTEDPRLDPNLVDLFGSGDATVYETAVRSGSLTNTQAWFRNNGGCQDTNNNLNDFTAGPVAGQARNTASTFNPCAATADLTVTVTDTPDPVFTGSPVTYTVNVPNSGTAAANTVTIEVELGGSANPGSIGGLTAPECSFDDPSDTINCAVASIAASGAFTFTFTVTPSTAGTITATANVSAAAPEITSNNTGSASTVVNDPVVTTADLTVSIADTPDPVVTGNAVGYTVTVNNAGNAAAENSQLSVVLSGAAFPGTVTGLPGTCSGNTPITCNFGSIAPAANVVVNFSITPTAAGEITLVATVSADAPETGGNNTDSETTTVTAPVPTIDAFNLASPDEGQILRTTTTTFQWAESTGATSYDVYVSSLSTNTRLGETYTVSKNAADVCAAGVCSLASTELVANLEQGTYSWTVVASNGSVETEASNGPNLFTVDLDGIELVANGSLEDGSVGWTFSATSAKVKCKAAWGNNSDCALKLRPGTKAHQRGVMGPILAATDTDAGNVLQVSAAVRTNKAAKQRVVMVVVKYVDLNLGAAGNGKDKFKLFVEQATVGYETFSANFVLAGEIYSGRVVVANTLATGTLRVDDVSVVLMPIGTAPRAEAPAEADGVLPVPAAPDNFRGSN